VYVDHTYFYIVVNTKWGCHILKLANSTVADLHNAAAGDDFFLHLRFGTFFHPFGAQKRRRYITGRCHNK
jgi:hypothetical protein